MLGQGRRDLFVTHGFRPPDQKHILKRRQQAARVLRWIITPGLVHQAGVQVGGWHLPGQYVCMGSSKTETVRTPDKCDSSEAAAEQ